MRKVFAGLIAGIILGGAGVAGAASLYWEESFAGYTCEGYFRAAICTDSRSNYHAALTKSGITIFQGEDDPVAWCKRSWARPSVACTSVIP